MSNSTLYDDDILLWSEHQAAVIRQLGGTRHVPNDLDVENVAEEIESVGRSELAAVKSYIRLIFIHLIKLVAEAGSEAESRWEGEIVAFHADMIDRYSPSMRQRIDIDAIWRSAKKEMVLKARGEQQQRVASLPAKAPYTLDDLLTEGIDGLDLVKRLQP